MFADYEGYGTVNIEYSHEIEFINQQLVPIDTFKISKASMAELPKLKRALMVIG
jgi:hypothetical protein